MSPVRDSVKWHNRAINRKKCEKSQKPMRADCDWKEINPGPYFFHRTKRAEDCNQTADARGRPHDRNVLMAWNQAEQRLQDSTGNAGHQIESQKFSGADELFDLPSKEIKAKAVEKHVPWPWN